MPFLCPHVICQTVINHVSTSFQPHSVRLFQPHTNPQQATQSSLTPTHNWLLSPASLKTTRLPFLVTLHATLPQEACHSPSQSTFPFSCLCNSLTGRRTLPIVLIVPLSRSLSLSHSKAHSCLLSFTLLMHHSYSCSSFLTCSRTLILVAYLAFSLHGTLPFATLTLRRTPPSTLSSHSPSTHSPLSRHPVRVTLSHDTHVLSLSLIDV